MDNLNEQIFKIDAKKTNQEDYNFVHLKVKEF